mmetsp:Transcript_13395/g.49753  ORF Transcript_13395/g.49753 Transcript_13395/m.49753 type:complete len:277 (+) Transcript_13395:2152-2982(+)
MVTSKPPQIQVAQNWIVRSSSQVKQAFSFTKSQMVSMMSSQTISRTSVRMPPTFFTRFTSRQTRPTTTFSHTKLMSSRQTTQRMSSMQSRLSSFRSALRRRETSCERMLLRPALSSRAWSDRTICSGSPDISRGRLMRFVRDWSSKPGPRVCSSERRRRDVSLKNTEPVISWSASYVNIRPPSPSMKNLLTVPSSSTSIFTGAEKSPPTATSISETRMLPSVAVASLSRMMSSGLSGLRTSEEPSRLIPPAMKTFTGHMTLELAAMRPGCSAGFWK